ncbi:MAG TPA: HEPN domain-containing protein [Aminobacteriaceae bacterium]|nr:HEPN domain-containing protein [Aminobacteriaceae bacterium]
MSGPLDEEVAAQAREWMRLAEMDLEVANYLFGYHQIPVEIICYHSQQSAEKYIKALMVSSGEEPPKTHNLIDLARICKEKKIAAEIWDGMASEIVGLNRFGTVPRYPSKIELAESDARRAVEDASSIREVITGRIPSQTSCSGPI